MPIILPSIYLSLTPIKMLTICKYRINTVISRNNLVIQSVSQSRDSPQITQRRPETVQRQSRDISETVQRQSRDSPETVQRPSRGSPETVQRQSRDSPDSPDSPQTVHRQSRDSPEKTLSHNYLSSVSIFKCQSNIRTVVSVTTTTTTRTSQAIIEPVKILI